MASDPNEIGQSTEYGYGKTGGDKPYAEVIRNARLLVLRESLQSNESAQADKTQSQFKYGDLNKTDHRAAIFS